MTDAQQATREPDTNAVLNRLKAIDRDAYRVLLRAMADAHVAQTRASAAEAKLERVKEAMEDEA